ncbi:MAG: translation initiation factor IF-2 subunit gamma [Candidatus Micrarchaeota archaeon]|nr:translation initiation factor IF-2 subunit gamma [Candidatus Micrarchaeota archaeon]
MLNQSELNIGTLGHVDHGKTTLTAAITHSWTDVHSESVKRSMTIKLGYADAVIKECAGKDSGVIYTTGDMCADGGAPKPIRRISLLDAPGHETLMATAIAGSNIIDGALFVISATEPCPMPQTKEHLMIIDALHIKDVVIVQTKIDIVGKDKAIEHYRQIKQFVKNSSIRDAPVIPVMANKDVNVDLVLAELAKIKVPDRDVSANPLMYIARSFDVNKPGTPIREISGGVIGGSIIRGSFKVGDEIEIRPGLNTSKDKVKREQYEPIITTISSISAGSDKLDRAIAGGLIAIGTSADPAITKADGLVGHLVGHVGKLPEPTNSLQLKYTQLGRDDLPKQAFRPEEPVLLGIGTGTIVGYIKKARKNALEITLRHLTCVDKSAKVSVLRNFSQRWRLSGYGSLVV